MKLYKLHIPAPYARFRLGSDGLDTLNDTIHSDTLFSALVNVCASAFGAGQATQLVQAFAGGQVAISSAGYGLATGGKQVLFFPRPALPFEQEVTQPAQRKKYKHLRWVSQGVLAAILASYNKTENWFTWQAGHAPLTSNLSQSCIALSAEIAGPAIPPLYYTDTSTKAALNRVSGGTVDGMLHYQTSLLVPHGTAQAKPFLYFMARIAPQWQTMFNTCINLLADTGIGGERSSGCGQFAGAEEVPGFTLPPLPVTHGLEYTLSLISPAAGELASLAAYNVIRRGGGYNAQGNSYFMVNMVREGAITLPGVKGSLCNIARSGAASYRNGLNFSIPF